ncbi:Central glycolyticproteinregulator [Ligilactobacillus acidipiscis DSM 15836]|uniref:Central glycolyticproteinregulator n=1 Tax=Ligilactobacillus acidipiscis DSM 15836 TaxID=1423716 RepID=A0ABR5PJW4_9LACO|nr:sugar-binding domain-containing protein [Ligilactobacillus acidipiscis]KRM27606.1 Central glycolyticproteinregulator [Ligilactobacillus acidipiscis DSM 15836]GAW63928.1 central glycolytic genes regulator [Ligilactobacillus acidipiscis]GEN21272.1 central glycolytic genes regulator [Ligilactobacillus acidipiscis]
MKRELEWIQTVVPDMINVLSRRFLILKSIRNDQPVGRRSLAAKLELSERALRTETDFLKEHGMIDSSKSGMSLTEDGVLIASGLDEFMDQMLTLQATENKLTALFGGSRCMVVPGDSDEDESVTCSMGQTVNEILQALLPEGRNIIAVMGGTTMAAVANSLDPKLSTGRDLMFVPARGGIGERVDVQANNICAQMAARTNGQHRALYVPEHVSEKTYEPLLREPAVREVIKLIKQSNAVIHSIGEAIPMAKRRSMSQTAIDSLKKQGAVGEAFGYFFNEKGEVIQKLSRIGLQLEDLASMKCVVAVAGGRSKGHAIAAYMKIAPSQTYLITDQGAANMILKG